MSNRQLERIKQEFQRSADAFARDCINYAQSKAYDALCSADATERHDLEIEAFKAMGRSEGIREAVKVLASILYVEAKT